jgi:hypothetical protein
VVYISVVLAGGGGGGVGVGAHYNIKASFILHAGLQALCFLDGTQTIELTCDEKVRTGVEHDPHPMPIKR